MTAFTKMRRQDREVPETEAKALLKLATWGILALAPDETGYPHAIPLNCAYVDGALLFHCAPEGKKLDILAKDDRACFVATISHEMLPEKYTSHYESVICYGRVSKVPREEVPSTLAQFAAGVFKVPVNPAIMKKSTEGAPATEALKMEIDRITGKRNGEHNSLA